MATRVRAVFDGEVLRLEDVDGLQAGVAYVVTIEEAPAAAEAEADVETVAGDGGGSASVEPSFLSRLGELAMDMGVEDLATRHDWYAHGRSPDDEDRGAGGEADSKPPYALTEIGQMAFDMGIEDFAARHDWYIHGTPPDDEPR